MDSVAREQLVERWKGQVVPWSLNAGFVTLSYVVSLIGTASTLELINRRTASQGKLNHSLLVSAAITMGGTAIWSMHYIGNRAINIADGQAQLQITYSNCFTAVSFFLPIVVLGVAFVAMGTNGTVSWWRVVVGGTLAGAAICGMHYLGNASINNYALTYKAGNVAGSALIAVAASIIALSAFFVFRGAWTNSWWKRGMSAVVLAGAVSGMHWCASMGTSYRLLALADTDGQMSRSRTVVVVVCLSVGACLVMAGFATYTARTMKRYALKAQQIVLAAAIFDKHGRVLVSPHGVLPCEMITESFLEKTSQGSFTVAHPSFHWMFQASRNWSSIKSIIDGISSHLSRLPHNGRDNSRGGIKLISDHGELIENYNIIFRELFCAAAMSLAERTKTPLASVGILWDEVLPTGASMQAQAQRQQDGDHAIHGHAYPVDTDTKSPEDLAEKGVFGQPPRELGRGSLMFLVRHVESARDMEKLTAAGYRFAELHQVSGIIKSTMQIKTQSVESKMRMMLLYAKENAMLEPGVHIGFFGIRACVNNAYGFDVLSRRNARNLLPSVQMPLARLDAWQMNFLGQFERMGPCHMSRRLKGMNGLSRRETIFVTQLVNSIEALRGRVESTIFDGAVLCSKTVEVPCRADSPGSAPGTCTMIAFTMVIPSHLQTESAKCEFVPLSLFRVHQLVYKDLPNHLAFARSVHRELAPIINAVPVVPRAKKPTCMATAHLRRASLRGARIPGRKIFRTGRPCYPGDRAVDADGNPIPTVLLHRTTSGADSGRSSSVLKLWSGRPSNGGDHSPARIGSVDSASPPYALEDAGLLASSPLHASVALGRSSPSPTAASFGGIMVSQEITVNVEEAGDVPGIFNSNVQRLHGYSGALLQQRRASEDGPGGDIGKGGPVMASDRGKAEKAAGTAPKALHCPGSGRPLVSIEMQPLPADGGIHHGGGVHLSNIEVEKPTDSPTFVDELLGLCVEGR